MSILSEQVKELRRTAALYDLSLHDREIEGTEELLRRAADTIEMLSEKMRGTEVQHGHIVWKRQIRGGYKYINVKCRNCGTTEHVEIEHPLDTKTPYCSECGKRLDDLFMEYCPNCGVDMDRTRDEEE